MNNLPEFIEHKQKCFQAHCPVYEQALAIAWETLEYYSRDDKEMKKAKDALRRIEELGK